jgi:hypothetical protein
MKLSQLGMIFGLAILLVGTWTYGSYQKVKSSVSMAAAARNFLAALTPEQRSKATFRFEDDQRMIWHFIPDSSFPRKGISFKELDSPQQRLAHAFLSTGLSQRGYLKATTIMSLESVLRELEQGKGPVRDTDLYFFTVFGEPSETQTWGWRVEGHHLSLNFTVVGGQMIAGAPSFLGSNPAEIKSGPRQGLRVLAQEEDLARGLVRSLSQDQLKIALINAMAPRDIITGNSRRAEPGSPAGLLSGKMTKKQVEQLTYLLQEYAHNLPEDVAGKEWERLAQAGIDKIHFAWAGGLEKGAPHYYRIQGPTFLVEYDNTQNDANHIHTVWRGFDRDWGLDLLKLHYQKDHSSK